MSIQRIPFFHEKNDFIDWVGLGWVGRSFYLLGRVLDQTLRVPFPPRPRFRANVDEVPGIGVVSAEDVVLGVVQQGEELVEEALLAFLGEFPVEAEHAAPEHGAEIVHVLVRGHPVFLDARVSRLLTALYTA